MRNVFCECELIVLNYPSSQPTKVARFKASPSAQLPAINARAPVAAVVAGNACIAASPNPLVDARPEVRMRQQVLVAALQYGLALYSTFPQVGLHLDVSFAATANMFVSQALQDFTGTQGLLVYTSTGAVYMLDAR